MKTLWAAPLLLAFSTVASAANEPAKAPPKNTSEAPKMVCFEAPRTGSNIKRRTCVTEAEAERRRKDDQLAADGLKRGSAGRSKSNTEASIRR